MGNNFNNTQNCISWTTTKSSKGFFFFKKRPSGRTLFTWPNCCKRTTLVHGEGRQLFKCCIDCNGNRSCFPWTRVAMTPKLVISISRAWSCDSLGIQLLMHSYLFPHLQRERETSGTHTQSSIRSNRNWHGRNCRLLLLVVCISVHHELGMKHPRKFRVTLLFVFIGALNNFWLLSRVAVVPPVVERERKGEKK